MAEDDAALLAAVCEGSDSAFNRLVDRHQQAIRTFLCCVASRNDVDDLAQETFVAAWTHARTYRAQASVRSWLLSIAWRKAKGAQRGLFRRRVRETAWAEAFSDETSSPAADVRIAVRQALDSVSVDQRAAIMLCLGYGFTHSEAADTLDIPLGTVKSHVARGRDRLREALGEGR
jgi:RNA polymerase sigma-70 factor (ECF subfamily)